MIEAEQRVWLFAAAVSLLVHGAVLWQARANMAESGHGTPAPVVTRVRFNSAGSAPSALAAITPPPEKQPPPRPVEKGPAAAALPKPAEPQAPSPAAEAAPTGSLASTAPVGGVAAVAQARQFYQSQLLAHIERHKFYPEAARRRGVTGGVRVAFLVGEGGVAAALECTTGPAILMQAACESVRRAVPLPLPPAELSLPQPVSFVMEFALK